jgi:hypothetical protein
VVLQVQVTLMTAITVGENIIPHCLGELMSYHLYNPMDDNISDVLCIDKYFVGSSLRLGA